MTKCGIGNGKWKTENHQHAFFECCHSERKSYICTPIGESKLLIKNGMKTSIRFYKDHEVRGNDCPDQSADSEKIIDEKSKQIAYTLIESNLVADKDVGTVKALQQIHAYIFGGLYDFAGQIRTKTISKGNTLFCLAEYLSDNLKTIEKMPETTFDEIVDKYVEMNVAHPFMEGNGRSTRIWLDLIFKKRLGLCVDWSRINKNDYLNAMIESHLDSSKIRTLLKQSLTDRIDDREIFMKGIDYSYYYEQVE